VIPLDPGALIAPGMWQVLRTRAENLAVRVEKPSIVEPVAVDLELRRRGALRRRDGLCGLWRRIGVVVTTCMGQFEVAYARFHTQSKWNRIFLMTTFCGLRDASKVREVSNGNGFEQIERLETAGTSD
jgi:hypothetical protein